MRDVPGARLHLTHLSTAEALDLVRRAKAAGLPVTCDVTPHHLAFTDEWVAGARRWAWEASGRPWPDAGPWSTAPCRHLHPRVNPPLRTPQDAAACLAALVDGTADAIATDHAPHTEVDKARRVRLASNGISGIETALGIVLAAVDAGRLPLLRAIEALTAGPAAVLGRTSRRADGGLAEGAPADLVVFDRSDRWTVTPEVAPLEGQELAAARPGAQWPRAAHGGRRAARLRGGRGLTSRWCGTRRAIALGVRYAQRMVTRQPQ